jgi:hypothetical protein
MAGIGFNHHKDAARVSLNNRQRASCCLQQRRQLSFDKPALLIWIADVTQRRTHVERTARLALGKYVIAAQMNLSSFTCGSQLFQVTVAQLSFFILLVANGLRISYAFGDGNGLGC